MLNPIEKFKVAILHLNRDRNHCCFNEIKVFEPKFIEYMMSVIQPFQGLK